jgi:hypothetical protein
MKRGKMQKGEGQGSKKGGREDMKKKRGKGACR